MRLFSRLGSWLRGAARGQLRGGGAREVDALLGARLPSVPADRFRAELLRAVGEAHDGQRAVNVTLDPSVEVLVIPRIEAMPAERERMVSADIDAVLAQLESAQRFSSVTWSALKDANPPFSPTPEEWGGEQGSRLEGETGIVFFIDVEAVMQAMAHAAEQQGFVARIDEEIELIRVTDGRFEAHVGSNALLAEALWTGRGPLSTISRRASTLAHELRGYAALVRALERRFTGRRFDVADGVLVARDAQSAVRLDYRQLLAAQLASGLTADAFLARARLDDLGGPDAGDIGVLLRSTSYLKAYPDALAATVDGAALIAVQTVDGVVRPVQREPDDHAERFEHYRDEARRTLPAFTMSAHAFVVEQRGARGLTRVACLVADKAATITAHPTLMRGVLDQLAPHEPRTRVTCATENSALFGSEHASAELLAEAKRRAAQLEEDLFSDGSDPLGIDHVVELPKLGQGRFELHVVPDAYFNVRDQAETRADLGRGHSDYLRGLSLELLGKPEAALPYFERAVRASQADGEMNLALGRTLSAVNDHKRAIVFLQRAAQALPEHADAANALGVALHKSGAAADAHAQFRRAVRLAPDEVGFLVNFGRTCCEQRLFHEARTALDHALRLEPSSGDAHAAMAVLCHKTGERQRALHHAREALSELPNDDTISELMSLLEEDESKQGS
ncbi:MAG: tetratricopeptide repeat protein [Deltaproteobacteria bacterium]|nr:tetratricopeptide repeat protein [Deltaproteobacteria bacterium]